MKNVFIDTNIVIDLLSRREPFFEEAANLFSLADNKKMALSASALTIANASYILLKQKKPNEAKAIISKLLLLVKILPLDDRIIQLALNDDAFSDFEDGLQYFTAMENKQDVIITRNLKDFKNANLPTMTAQQFIETLK